MGSLMIVHMNATPTQSKRQDSSPAIEPVDPAGYVVPLSLFMLRSESDESDRPASPTNDAREGQEQTMSRQASVSSDDSTQLIPPQNVLNWSSIDKEGAFDTS